MFPHGCGVSNPANPQILQILILTTGSNGCNRKIMFPHECGVSNPANPQILQILILTTNSSNRTTQSPQSLRVPLSVLLYDNGSVHAAPVPL